MPVPGNLTTITVTGTYVDFNGNPMTGAVTFTPSADLVDAGASEFLSPGPITLQLDSSGHFSTTLICTDNTNLQPPGWVYIVTESVRGTRTYPIALPHTLGSSVDLTAVVPIPVTSGSTVLTLTGSVAPGYGALAYSNTWTNTNTFTGTTAFTGPVTGVSTLAGVTVSGAAVSGYSLVATSANTATWQLVTGGGGGAQIAGDLGGTLSVPTVISTHLSAPLPLAQGGTNATSASGARTNLGLGSAAVANIDATAADILPVGTQAAGAVGKVADAGHVHPYQPHVFSVVAAGAKGDGLASATGVVNASSNLVTIGETKFNAATDVGKLIMVKYAASTQANTGQSTAVGTITAVNSTTQVQASFTAAVSGTALLVLWATDDTAAIQSAINSANTFGLAHGLGQIYFPAPTGLFYAVGGPLKSTDGVNAVYNSQLTIPVNPENGPGVTLVFRGCGDNGQPRYWNADFPAFNGGVVSFGVFANSTAQTNSINAGGNPSVIGAPTGKFNYGVIQGSNAAPTYTNTCVSFQDFTITTTHSNSGWTYSAANMFGAARCHARNFAYGTTGLVQYYKFAPGLGDFSNITQLAGGLSVGLIMPSNGNNASNYLSNVVCNGGYTFGLFGTEHCVGNDVKILYCWSGFCPVGTYSDSAALGIVAALHASYWDQLTVEGCAFHVNVIGPGANSSGPSFHAVMDTEGAIALRDFPSDGTGLSAANGVVRLTGSATSITVSTGTGTGATGGTGLKIIVEQTLPGIPSTGIPTLVANTAVSNTLWRDATVYLVGGTNLTTIQVSRLAGGVSSVPVATVADFTSAGTIAAPFPVRLGPGQWIKVNTSSGTALPTATWVLD